MADTCFYFCLLKLILPAGLEENSVLALEIYCFSVGGRANPNVSNAFFV